MTTTPAPAGRRADSNHPSFQAPPNAEQDPSAERSPRRALPLMRRVDVAVLAASGRVEEISRLVPSVQPFEDAFAAFARGTLFPTDAGLVAVEDLWPGMRIRVADGGFAPLTWRGSTMVV